MHKQTLADNSAEMEVSGAGATTTVPQGLAHLPFDAHLSNSFSIDALLLASSHVPMADSTTNSQSWDVDPFSTDEHWLPLDMDMTNRDLPRDQITEDSDWGMPYKVAGELVGHFFANVQTWLTFVHRPTFYRRFVRDAGQQPTVIESSALSPDQSFMIYAMFALAARFSTSEHFKDIPIHDRGELFASRAATIKDSIIKTVEEPSLEFVKGCVMLAFYNFAAGQIGPASVLSSVCVRFAYELSLDEIDEDQMDEDGLATVNIPEESGESWLKKEEKRRLWWSIWELDTFASTCAFHPFNIERGEMKVLLPAPDHNWLCGIPIRSAFIDPRAEFAWKGLQMSPNHSTRAWFLVANYLKSTIIIHSRRSFRHTTISRCRLDAALCNLKLSLPSDFHLRSLFLDADNYQEKYWVIATHLMIMIAETILERSPWPRQEGSETGSPLSVQDKSQFAKRITSYLYRIGGVWAPEYIPLYSPILCCAVIVPGSTDPLQSDHTFRGREVAKNIVTHFAKHWPLGAKMLRLLELIEHGPSHGPNHESEEDKVLFKQYSILLPNMSKRKKVLETPSEQFREDDLDTASSPMGPSPELQDGNNIHDTFGTWSPFGNLGMLPPPGRLSDLIGSG